MATTIREDAAIYDAIVASRPEDPVLLKLTAEYRIVQVAPEEEPTVYMKYLVLVRYEHKRFNWRKLRNETVEDWNLHEYASTLHVAQLRVKSAVIEQYRELRAAQFKNVTVYPTLQTTDAT